jgi:hypothetical protein
MSYKAEISVKVSGTGKRKYARIEAEIKEIGRFRRTFTDNVSYPNWFERKALKRTFDSKLKKAIINIKLSIDDFIINHQDNIKREKEIKEKIDEILN